MFPRPARILAVLVSASLLSIASAQEQEIQAARKRIQDLELQAQELREQGQLDQAKEVAAKAQALRKRLDDEMARLKKQRQEQAAKGRQEPEGKRPPPEKAEGILRGLTQGIEALNALGRHEEAKHLAEIAGEVKEKLARQHEGAARQHPEIEAATRQLEVMRVAKKALAEAEKHDAIELLERAIRAREVSLEGRKDEEAARIRERAPTRGQQAELLAMAAQLYKEWNMPDRAGMVAEMSQALAGQERERAQAREREQGGPEVAELEQRVRELAAQLEKLSRQLEQLRRSAR
jgi:dTMP kinase